MSVLLSGMPGGRRWGRGWPSPDCRWLLTPTRYSLPNLRSTAAVTSVRICCSTTASQDTRWSSATSTCLPGVTTVRPMSTTRWVLGRPENAHTHTPSHAHGLCWVRGDRTGQEKGYRGLVWGSPLAEVEGSSLSLTNPLLRPQALLDVKSLAHQNKFGEDMPHSH